MDAESPATQSDNVEPVPVEAEEAEEEEEEAAGAGAAVESDDDDEMVVPVEAGGASIKVEQADEREMAESLSLYINLTAELDTETILHVVSPKLFERFSMFELMLQKAKLSIDFGAMETLLNDTASVLSELKLLIESCLRPVRVRKWEEDEDGRKRRKKKRTDESVEIDDMLAMALCLDSGVWKKREPEDIDYYSGLLNMECLFPERKERGPGRPKGSLGQKRIKIKKEDGMEEDEEEEKAVEEKEDKDKSKEEEAETEAEEQQDEDDEDYEDEEKSKPKAKKRKVEASTAPKMKKKRGRKPKIKTEVEERERERFTCEKCGKTYVSATALYKHIEKTCAARESMKVEFTRVDDDFFCAFTSCSMAKTVFPTKEDLDDHWAEHHAEEDDKIIPCFLCELKFATTGAKKVHMNRDHEKKFRCEECDKMFFTKGNLTYHMKSHTKIKLEDGTEMLGETYLCLKCGQTLCKAYGKQHEAKCTGLFVRHPEYRKLNEEYFCTVGGCNLGYGFNSIYGLRQHFHNAHIREEERFFSCDYCDEKFSFKTTRNKHIKAKHLKTYVCDICGKGFGGKDKLTSHRFTHTGEKPYSCDKCDYRAAKKYNLEMHKQSKHSDFEQKNYLCAICNKQFVTMGRVRRHMQVIHAEGKETTPGGGRKKRHRTLPPVPMPGGGGGASSAHAQSSQHEVVHHVEDQEYMHPLARPHETVITVTPMYH